MKTTHNIFFKDAKRMDEIKSKSINLVVTSPPYPMIEMWDNQFSISNTQIGTLLKNKEGKNAYQLMHRELEKIWVQFDRVLCDGGIVCINIGDATRKIGDSFRLYSNHSKINRFFEDLGFESLPDIIWRKQTNKPNKFMGSGMYPVNAYVTLEHEFILIFRKNGNRTFTPNEIQNRRNSVYFWEERNNWFSDVWFDLKGIKQNSNNGGIRQRTGAFPFELAYRLINMYSIQGDTILDPFIGTGTTTFAAMSSMRNSIGYEIDNEMGACINSSLDQLRDFPNQYNIDRVNRHIEFIDKKIENGKEIKYLSKKYGFKVITNQEKEIIIPLIKDINLEEDGKYSVGYTDLTLKTTEQDAKGC
jgi:DNA modification methylase